MLCQVALDFRDGPHSTGALRDAIHSQSLHQTELAHQARIGQLHLSYRWSEGATELIKDTAERVVMCAKHILDGLAQEQKHLVSYGRANIKG